MMPFAFLLLLQLQGGEEISNLRVFQRLAREIGGDVVTSVGSRLAGTPSVNVLPRESGWFLQQDFAAPFAGEKGARVDSTVVLEVGIIDARVFYEDIRRDGFFGAKIVDRVVTLSVRTRFVSPSGAPVAGEWTKSARDTVEYDRLESLEMPGVPMTRGAVPAQGVWQGLLEPLIVVGSIGVAVVLLFAVRS